MAYSITCVNSSSKLGKGFAFVGSQYHLEIGDQDFYLDLLFFHLRLRCFVVIDLKVDDFKPEYAGRMKFYLSAVDDRLRHPADAPTIGLILCKGRYEVIVAYALRDSAKPLGVAAYRVSSQLPQLLEADLPTQTELAREYPLMALVKLRIDIERMLRQLTQQHGAPKGPPAIRSMLEQLAQGGGLPQSAAAFGETLRVLNAATHGGDFSAAAPAAALDAGTQLLDELKKLWEPERPPGCRRPICRCTELSDVSNRAASPGRPLHPSGTIGRACGFRRPAPLTFRMLGFCATQWIAYTDRGRFVPCLSLKVFRPSRCWASRASASPRP